MARGVDAIMSEQASANPGSNIFDTRNAPADVDAVERGEAASDSAESVDADPPPSLRFTEPVLSREKTRTPKGNLPLSPDVSLDVKADADKVSTILDGVAVLAGVL